MYIIHDVNGRDFSNRKVLSRQNLNPSHATLQSAKAWNSLSVEMKPLFCFQNKVFLDDEEHLRFSSSSLNPVIVIVVVTLFMNFQEKSFQNVTVVISVCNYHYCIGDGY